MRILTAKNNADTNDIIYHLCMAAPAAIAQVKKMNLAEIIGLTGSNVQKDAELAGKWIRAEIKYKMDGYDNQNIQFPSALLKSKNGDCKSLSLLYLAIMENAGYNGGFRFASYRPNGKFTHVYNYFLDKSIKKFIFDACSKNLSENKNYKSIKDMRVNYLAGQPVMLEDQEFRPVRSGQINGVPVVQFLDTGEIISEPEFIARKRLKDRINDKWKEFKDKNPKLADTIKKGVDAAPKISFAPSRAAFLVLLTPNFRGYTSKLQRWMNKDSAAVKKFWESFGGDYNKLQQVVDKGSKRKPLFGEKNKRGVSGLFNYAEDYVGVEPVTTAASSQAVFAAIAAAAPIIAALVAAFKKAGIKDTPEETPPTDDGGLPPLPEDPLKNKNFTAADPEGDEARAYNASGGQVFVTPQGQVVTGGSNLLNPKTLLIFGGVALAAFVLLKKKK